MPRGMVPRHVVRQIKAQGTKAGKSAKPQIEALSGFIREKVKEGWVIGWLEGCAVAEILAGRKPLRDGATSAPAFCSWCGRKATTDDSYCQGCGRRL